MAQFRGRISNISLQIVHAVDNLQGKKGVMGLGFWASINRGCRRFAPQPPATRCDPSGIENHSHGTKAYGIGLALDDDPEGIEANEGA